MTELRAGVIGVGHLGALHAEKYAALDGVTLAGVYDIDGARAEAAAERFGCFAAPALDELLGRIDVVSVAVPAAAHRDVGLRAAAARVHLLMEKPLAADAAEGRELARAAEQAGIVLQVGHLERFNPVYEEMRTIVSHPRFIECHRLSPFGGRGGDTNVVFDVMIHDLDLVAFLVGSELTAVDAIGVPVLSDHVDIANARLRFAGGCVANVTASRVSLKRERKLRVFQEDAYLSVDFDERRVTVARKRAPGVAAPSSPMEAIEVEERRFSGADPLLDEIASFLACVRSGARPKVGAAEALAALELAERIVAALA